MDDNTKYFERAIWILFESKDRDFRKILYKVAAIDPRALVEAVDGVETTATIEAVDIQTFSEECLAVALTYPNSPSLPQDEIPTDAQSFATKSDKPKDLDIVEKLYNSGNSVSKIAEVAGVSETTVYKWRHRTQLPNAFRTSLLLKFAYDTGVIT